MNGPEPGPGSPAGRLAAVSPVRRSRWRRGGPPARPRRGGAMTPAHARTASRRRRPRRGAVAVVRRGRPAGPGLPRPPRRRRPGLAAGHEAPVRRQRRGHRVLVARPLRRPGPTTGSCPAWPTPSPPASSPPNLTSWSPSTSAASSAWAIWRAPPAGPDTLIVLDHHPDNERFGTINVVDTGAAATAVVVRRLAAALGWRLTRDAAVCLYAGLVTDTGRFRYPNTTPRSSTSPRSSPAGTSPSPASSGSCSRSTASPTCASWARPSTGPASTPTPALVTAWCTTEDLDHFGVDLRRDRGPHRHRAPGRRGRGLLRPARGPRRGRAGVAALHRRPRRRCRWPAGFGGGGHWFMSGFQADAPLPEAVRGGGGRRARRPAGARRAGFR